MLLASTSFLDAFVLSKIKEYFQEKNTTKELEKISKDELIQKKFSAMTLFERRVASLYVATFAPDEQDAGVEFLRNELHDFDDQFKLDGFYHLFVDHWYEMILLIMRTNSAFPSYLDSYTLSGRRQEGVNSNECIYPFLLQHEEFNSLVEGIKFSISHDIQTYFDTNNELSDLLFYLNLEKDALEVEDFSWNELKDMDESSNRFVQIAMANIRGCGDRKDLHGFYDPRLCKLFDKNPMGTVCFLMPLAIESVKNAVISHIFNDKDQLLECIVIMKEKITGSIEEQLTKAMLLKQMVEITPCA